MAELIRVVQQVLIEDILHSGLNKAYRLAFITIFNIKVVVAYLLTLVFINVVNKFQLL